MFAAAFVGYQVLFAKEKPSLDVLTAELLTIGIAFLIGVGSLSVGIWDLHSPYLPALARFVAMMGASGGIIVYGKMISKLWKENYTVSKFGIHVSLLIACAVVTLFLDQIHPAPIKSTYAILFLVGGVVHINVMIMHYVVIGAKSPATVLGDIVTFFSVICIALALFGKIGVLVNRLAERLTKTILTV